MSVRFNLNALSASLAASEAEVAAARRELAAAEQAGLNAQRAVSQHTFAYAQRAVHPYELVQHLDSREHMCPRSFYTLLEAAATYPEVAEACGAKTLHLCEAPGSFVDAALRLSGNGADWHACSLVGTGPQFRSHLMQAKKPNGHSRVILGESGTGNLLERDTALCVVYECGGAQLVTADGEADAVSSSALTAAQLYTAFHALEPNGHLLLRLDTMTQEVSLRFLTLLRAHFGAVELFKPATVPSHAPTLYAVCLDFGMAAAQRSGTAVLKALEQMAFGDGDVESLPPPSEADRLALNGIVCTLLQQQAKAITDAASLSHYLHSIGVVSVVDVRAHFAQHLSVHKEKTRDADALLRLLRGLIAETPPVSPM
jgi:23S rRNA U2552 (ribose-2'-O)-methylase RlmE/FtsJ